MAVAIGTERAENSPRFEISQVTFRGETLWKVKNPFTVKDGAEPDGMPFVLAPLDLFTADGYATEGPHSILHKLVGAIDGPHVVKQGGEVIGLAEEVQPVDGGIATGPAPTLERPAKKDPVSDLLALMQMMMTYTVKLVEFQGTRYHAVQPHPIKPGEPTYLFQEDKGLFTVGENAKATGNALTYTPRYLVTKGNVLEENGAVVAPASEVISL